MTRAMSIQQFPAIPNAKRFDKAMLAMRTPTKELATATYLVIEDILAMTDDPSIDGATEFLHAYAASQGQTVGLGKGRLATYHRTVQWVQDQTGSPEFPSTKGDWSFEQYYKGRKDHGTLADVHAGKYFGVGENGSQGAGLWSVLKRAMTSTMHEHEIVAITAKGRATSSRDKQAKAINVELEGAMPYVNSIIDIIDAAA